MTAAAVEPTRSGAGVPSTKEAAAANSSGSPTRVLPETRDKARHDAKYDKKKSKGKDADGEAGGDSDKEGGKEGKRKVLQGTKYQYELGRKLGQGGYAKVKYATTIEPPEDAYAVKIFKVSLLKRRRIWDAQQAGFKTAFDDVQREIAIMKRLSNPNVMRMHDVVDDASVNKLYMVMDYCPKGAVMETDHLPCDPLDHEDCKKWFADSVVGLEYLHFQGVIHYDLKPDNILIAGDGRAVISDFGVSRVHPDRSCDAAVGSPGTPTYTAPEGWGSARRGAPHPGWYRRR